MCLVHWGTEGISNSVTRLDGREESSTLGSADVAQNIASVFHGGRCSFLIPSPLRCSSMQRKVTTRLHRAPTLECSVIKGG